MPNRFERRLGSLDENIKTSLVNIQNVVPKNISRNNGNNNK